jgi:ribonuclease III
MTLYKIALVREETLAIVAKDIGIQNIVLISKGEEKTGGREKPSILSDTLEALIGYIAIDL